VAQARRLHGAKTLHVSVVGIFDNARLAEEARRALLAVGVPEARIAIESGHEGVFTVSVDAQSSLERERIRDVLQRKGATCMQRRFS
jgi:hypothetical protein